MNKTLDPRSLDQLAGEIADWEANEVASFLKKQAERKEQFFTIGDIPAGAAVHRWMVFNLQRPEMPNIAAWQGRLAERKGFHLHVASREFHLSG